MDFDTKVNFLCYVPKPGYLTESNDDWLSNIFKGSEVFRGKTSRRCILQNGVYKWKPQGSFKPRGLIRVLAETAFLDLN